MPRQGQRPGRDDGRALRPRRDGVLAGARAARCTSSTPSTELPRRPRASSAGTCRWRPARRSPSSTRASDQVTLCFFGDGGGEQGRVPRVAEPGGALEAALHLHLREQPLRHGHGHRARARPSTTSARARRLRHGQRDRGRHGRAGGARGASGGPWSSRAGTSMPTLIEARTYRFRGHSMSRPGRADYRTKEEVEEEKRTRPDPAVFQTDPATRACSIKRDSRRWTPRSGRSSTRRWSSPSNSPEPPASALYEDVYSESYGRTRVPVGRLIDPVEQTMPC